MGKAIVHVEQIPLVMTVEDVALLLDVTEECVRNMFRSGELAGFKAGREWRIHKNKVLEFAGIPVPEG